MTWSWGVEKARRTLRRGVLPQWVTPQLSRADWHGGTWSPRAPVESSESSALSAFWSILLFGHFVSWVNQNQTNHRQHQQTETPTPSVGWVRPFGEPSFSPTPIGFSHGPRRVGAGDPHSCFRQTGNRRPGSGAPGKRGARGRLGGARTGTGLPGLGAVPVPLLHGHARRDVGPWV